MKTITEQNALIAEFMGIEPRQINATSYGWNDGPFFACSYPTKAEVMQAVSKYAKYHESWDWLIPVVKKIDSWVNESMSFAEYDDYRTSQWRMIDNPSKYNIDQVHAQAVQLIERYNQEQAKKGDK